ncbi:MAG: methyltransferase domain-containing protein [Pseudomonadota bacterium]
MTADPYRRLMLLRNYDLDALDQESEDGIISFRHYGPGEEVDLFVDGSAYHFGAVHGGSRSEYFYREGGLWSGGPAEGQPISDEEFIHLNRLIHKKFGGHADMVLEPPSYARPVIDIWDKVTGLLSGPNPPNRPILDIGCGTGWLLEYLKCAGLKEMALGVEPAEERVALANMRPALKINEKTPGTRVRQGAAEDLPAKDDHFSQAVFWFSLHHVPEDKMVKALEEARRVTGGLNQYVVVVEPVAAGEMYEVERLIIDEATERAAALQAMYQFGELKGVTRIIDATIATTMSYESPEEFLFAVGAVDQNRQETIDQSRDAFIEAFLEQGHWAGHYLESYREFAQDVRLVIFKIDL